MLCGILVFSTDPCSAAACENNMRCVAKSNDQSICGKANLILTED